jgi:transcriptional regulator with XRE-family HTH domain
MGRQKKDKEITRVIGLGLDRAIKEKGLKKRDIAEKIGCSPVTISNYISGKREIDDETAEKLSKIIGIPVSELLTPAQLNNQKMGKIKQFRDENGIFEKFLRELGFDFFVGTDKSFNLTCGINKHRPHTYDDEFIKVLTAINDYNAGNSAGISDDEYKELLQRERQFHKDNYPTLKLTETEWDGLRNEISQAVTDIVKKRIENVSIDRHEFSTMLYAVSNVLGLLDDDLMKKALNPPYAPGKETIDCVSILALNGYLKRYRQNSETLSE